MKDRFFLDTNIFAYSFDTDSQSKSKQAQELIFQGIETHKGVISYQVIQEFFNVAFRKFSHPMPFTDAEQYLQTIFQSFLIVQPSTILFSQALRLKENHLLSWYDSLLVSAAIESQCTILFSEDFNHEQKFGKLQIRNPFL
jgi:predicted nucleic acid-binding protein